MENKKITVTPADPNKQYYLPKGGTKIPAVMQTPKTGDAEIPAQPGKGALVQTMSDVGLSHSPKNALDATPAADNDAGAASTGSDYKTLNEQIWGAGGTGQQGYEQQVESQRKSGGAAAAFTKEELLELYKAAGVDPNLMYEWSNHGGYTQSLETALAGGGTGNPVDGFYRPGTWYYYDGTPRAVKAGTSGADEHYMSDGNLLLLRYIQDQYEKAAPEEKSYWNNMAERLRAGSKYSGGSDGSMYIPLAQLEIEQAQQDILGGGTGGSSVNGAGTTGGSTYPDTPEGRMQAILDAWQAAALEQSSASVDYAVQQAITEYERILEDAQPQFKAQAESVARDEMQTLDNAALYAELRGDKGGIGQEQYSSIQNTAAQNRLAVQQAQTKVAADTARAIEDLRMQGEFEKADAMLEITQEYLSQLMSIEQWAAEYNFSQEQFKAQLQQWAANYELELHELQLAQDRWETEFSYGQYLDGIGVAQTEKSQLAEVGWAMLELGFMPDEKYLDAMQIDQTMAEQMLAALESPVLEESGFADPAEIYWMLYEADFTDESDQREIADYLKIRGYNEEWVNSYAREYIARGYEQINRYYEPAMIGSGITEKTARELGYRSWDELWSAANNTQDMKQLLDLFEHVYRACNEEQLNDFYDLITHRSMTTDEQSRFVAMIEGIRDYNPLAAGYAD